VDDALGEEVRVTVIAAGFDKVVERAGREGRLSRILDEPVSVPGEFEEQEQEPGPVPSILIDDEDEIFKPVPERVPFDAEEDLDIPDFLKS
jgi:cell division GTPase FtsZ